VEVDDRVWVQPCGEGEIVLSLNLMVLVRFSRYGDGPMTNQLIGQVRGPTTDRSVAARRVSLRSPYAEGLSVLDPDESGPALGIEILVDIAVGLGRAEALWRPHVDHDPLSRTSVRLVATDLYEAWLLGWTPSQQVELHDHGGANAAFVVLEGALTELTLGDGRTSAARLDTGDLGKVAAGVVHDVLNAGRTNATSLHVYSRPLRTMTFYDPDGIPSYTELVEQVPALVTSQDQARGLHPSTSNR
jgi:predicted metal-dependent enzyme (double-stranded beta helix superfamily)